MMRPIRTNLKMLSTVAILAAVSATPTFAQEFAAIGPGSHNGLQPEPGPVYGQGYGPEHAYYQGYATGTGSAPFDLAAGIVNGAVNTAGAIATAPFRAFDMMQGDASYCAQRYRSYDQQSGTYLGYDGQRHPCE